MPNRLIKESLCYSEKIAALSDFEFRVWIGLILQADDLGHGDARPAIIKGRVFPLRERVAQKDIESAILTLAAHSCVSLYEIDGKPYYSFPKWAEHQRVRNVKPKYPLPPETDGLPQSAASCGNLRPESNPIQSESNTESESESESNVRARSFDRFWSAYPRKVGKEAARKAFRRVSAPIETLLDAIERQKRSRQWQEENGRFIPNPATWLNQGRWEDEPLQDTQEAKTYRGGDFFDDDL